MRQNVYPENDPRYHTTEIKVKLNDLSKHAREKMQRVKDARAKVLLETTADLISGLNSVYEDFEAKRTVVDPEAAPAEKSRKPADTDMFL